MYYDTMSVDSLLKCSFCASKFSTVVKLIPDCVSSICGECYEILTESVDQTKRYKCQSCGQHHSMPTDGLRDNPLALNILKLQRNEKPLSKGAVELKSLIEEVHEKINMLKSRDDTQEINVYCDSLEMDVNMAADSAIKHVKSIQEGLLKEINAYRSEILATRSKNSVDSVKNGELDELSRKADLFSKQWQTFFNQMKQQASESQIDIAKTDVRNLISQTEKLKHKLDCKMLKGRFLKFKENESFNTSNNLLGSLVFDFSFDHTPSFSMERPRISLDAYNNVYQLVFLSDGNLAICYGGYSIYVFSAKKGKFLYELKSPRGSITTLASLDNALLAAGCSEDSIQIWDLSKKEVVRFLNTKYYTSSSSPKIIKALKNGFLASWSYNGNVEIWDTNTGLNGLSFQGSSYSSYLLAAVSNNQLVTYSESERKIEILNAETGKPIKSISTKKYDACSMGVLKDDRIAIGYKDGCIKIFDPADDSKIQALEKCHQGEVSCLLALFDRYLVSGGPSADPTIKIWDVVGNKLVRTLSNQHTSYISSLSVSKDGKYLISSSRDKYVKIWSLEH